VTAPTLGILAPALSPTAWVVVAVVLVVVAVVTVVCVVRARRLDRLHRRTDAARAGLADALERRGEVALRVADALAGHRVADAAGVRAAAHGSLTACHAGLRTAGAALDRCEAAENALTRRLAAVDRAALPDGLTGELVDAEELVLLARRVHNDAVRDTLDLRSRRLVRWLRLAGTAPAPAYFEIADPQQRRDGPSQSAAGPAVSGVPGRRDAGAA
jgi:hypothetical protein